MVRVVSRHVPLDRTSLRKTDRDVVTLGAVKVTSTEVWCLASAEAWCLVTEQLVSEVVVEQFVSESCCQTGCEHDADVNE